MYQPLKDLGVCLDWLADTPEPAWRAMRFATTVAAEQGAQVVAAKTCPTPEHPFYISPVDSISDPSAWAAQDRTRRILLTPNTDTTTDLSSVSLTVDPMASEAVLFAASGLADLNGDPNGLPLVPNAHYAAHTIGYAVYTALVGVYGIGARQNRVDQAHVDGLAVLKWINWKAIAAGAMGMAVTRDGALAEWPVLECADGHVALLFMERDWPAMIKMVDDPALADPRFDTFKGREEHRAAYLPILQAFCMKHTKAKLRQKMQAYEIPGDTVRTIADVLDCDLFAHRGSFDGTGPSCRPRLPERVLATAGPASQPAKPAKGDLPLAGLRVLDLGIITAGAGVSAVLADMGAEVLKIESSTYPDPFRQWAGSSDSPLFRFNNRNKFGLDIDLKTPDGKALFLDLVKAADIVIENFRRGVIERLGLGFDTLSQVNPRILLVSVSGQGQTGPGTQTSTFGSTLEANAGFAALTRDADGQPYVTGRALNFPDQVICLYGAGVAAAAALEAQASGVGRHLDVSQRDTVLYQIGDVVNWVARGHGESAHALCAGIGRPAVDTILTCADGTHIAVHVPTTFDGVAPWGKTPVIEWVSHHPADFVETSLQQAGCGATRVMDGINLAKDRGLFSAAVFAKDPAGNVVKGVPFRFAQTPTTIQTPAPLVGEHNAMFLGEREKALQ